MRICMALVMVLAVGCKGKSAAPAAGSAAAGSGSAIAVGSGSADKVGEAPAAKCDLAGKYRVRFSWNGTDGYWLRFSVGGTPPVVTLDGEPHMLKLGKQVDAKLDTTACKIAMTSGKGSELIELEVNPTTHLVTGTLVRPGEKDPQYGKTPIAGAHDVPGAAAQPAPCFEPGVYEITLDKKAKWKNVDADDSRSCKETPTMFDPIYVRLEILGGEVTLDTVDAKPPYREVSLVDETVQVGKACDVAFKTLPEGVQLETQLTFAPGGKVSGVGKRAEYQFVEDGDEGENLWSCEAKDIPLTIKRVATP